MPLPGGTSVSHVQVYDTVGPDGLAGGSPHLHTVCTEAYLVIAGEGMVQTLVRGGVRRDAARPRHHRLVLARHGAPARQPRRPPGALRPDVERRAARGRRHGARLSPVGPRGSRRLSSDRRPPGRRSHDRRCPRRRVPAARSGRRGIRALARTRSRPPAPERSTGCTPLRSISSGPARRHGTRSSTRIRPVTSSVRAPRSSRCADPTGRQRRRASHESAVRSRSLLPATRAMGCCGTLGTVVH